jgi:uncharacterized protein YmfQ (DUF2313 family)
MPDDVSSVIGSMTGPHQYELATRLAHEALPLISADDEKCNAQGMRLIELATLRARLAEIALQAQPIIAVRSAHAASVLVMEWNRVAGLTPREASAISRATRG